jgi:hypothetical protein
VSNSEAGWGRPRLLGSALSRRDSRVGHTSRRLLPGCLRLCIGMWVAPANALRPACANSSEGGPVAFGLPASRRLGHGRPAVWLREAGRRAASFRPRDGAIKFVRPGFPFMPASTWPSRAGGARDKAGNVSVSDQPVEASLADAFMKDQGCNRLRRNLLRLPSYLPQIVVRVLMRTQCGIGAPSR